METEKLIKKILKEVYGSKYYENLKKQEPYFYNAISEAILISYNKGKMESNNGI